MAEMERYDAGRKCPKCGHDDVGTCYSPRSRPLYGTTKGLMLRICRLCGYQWNELPLDAEPEGKTA